MVATAESIDISVQRDAFTERLFGATLAALDVVTIYIGDQLDLYQTLTGLGSATSSELAAASNLSERYVREWLEGQTIAGILALDEAGASAIDRRFRLPAGHVEVLTARDSLNYLAPLAQAFIGLAGPVHEVIEAFRSGGGVPYADFGKDLHEGQARINRNLFMFQLGQEYFSAIPEIHAKLSSAIPARIADIGCGHGWSSIGMALAYPNVRVDGFDLDEASVIAAQGHLQAQGVEDRVTVQLRNAGDPSLAGQYDLVTAFECIHDMADPVSALATMRRLAGDEGIVIVMDERVNEEFSPEGGDVERFMYGCSILHCLPVGMADQPSAGTGTVMRPSTLRRYAIEAGFSELEILPLENFFFNFYRLHL